MRSPVLSSLVRVVRRAVTFSQIMLGLNRRASWVLTSIAAALLFNGSAANAQTTFTCSTLSGSNCALTVGASQTTASTSSFTVPTAGSISSISIQLHGVWADGATGYSMGAAEFLLTGPGGSFDLLGDTGDTIDGDDNQDAGSGLHGLNIVIVDGANPAPMACGGLCSAGETNNWPAGNGSSVGNAGTITVTVKPGSYFGYDPSSQSNPPILGVLGDWPDTDGCNPDPIIGNSGTYNNAAFCSAPTLTSKYGTTTANGTWTLTVQNVSGYPTAISITDWSLTITYSAATPTTTTVTSNANPSNSSNTVTFTATVTSTGGTPTGTVAFTANGATIAGCGAQPLSGGQATCPASLGQGNNGIQASYTPTGDFGASNATMNQLVEATPTQTVNTWCNSGQITAPGNSAGIQYPSVIHVSGYPAGATVGGNLTVELMNATGPAGVNAYHLLVAPAGQNLDFFDSTFAYQQPSSPVNLTIYDDAGQTPSGSSAPSTGNYDPYDGNENGVANDGFPSSSSPSVDSSIPQVPGTINRAAPLGGTSFTNFQQAFSGAPANGDWALYTYAGGGESEAIQGGWCVTLDVNTGVGTTTTVTANPNPQATGQAATLTATVLTQGSNTPVTSGTVTFLDNNAVPAGVTNNTVSLDGNGHAQIATSSLTEGDHPFTATYNGTSADNGSFGTVVQRINDGTTIYAANAAISNGPSCGAAYCYCNGGPVSTTATYKGAFTPNPSILIVTDLPGTIGTVSLGLNQYSSSADILYSLESMVVNPTGADLDFFSNAGYSSGGGTAGLGNYLFSDSAGSPISSSVSTLTPGTYKPSSYPEGDPNWPEPAQPYFLSSSGFYTLPSGITYATSRGSGTFASQFGNTDPNGTWALYMTEDDPAGAASAAYGWCVNFTENPVTVSVDLSHQGTGTGTDFVAGENGAQITTVVTTDDTSGPTGDPLGTNPLQVVDTLPSGLTYQSASGTGWSCSPSGQTITCTNDEAIAQGGSYPTLTLNVNVSSGALGSLSNGVTVTGAGITGNTGSDTITVDPGTTLAVSKSHTGNFTTGSTGQWSIVVSNTAAGGATTGTVNVSDTLPTGYTLASYTSTSSLWTCNGASNVVTCSATPGIAGGSSSTITLTVNVPANSPTSVSNTALAWGGGDVIHTNAGSAAASNTDTVTVDAAPAITSAGSSTFTVGSAGNFTVTTTGNPTASLSKTGSLPTGVTFIDNGNGTGTLSGTPAAGTGGTYPLTITAANGTSPNATQNFTLIVVGPPSITSANSATFTAGVAGAFTVTTSGSPTPALSESGALPTGVTFIDNGNGTATISGTATLPGSYPITMTAQNGTLPNATQSFTLAVNPGAATHIGLVAPASTFAGSPISVTLTAYDLYGNVATSYGGTVVFTSTDPVAFLPGSSTITNGTGTFTAYMETAGSQTITATDAANSLAATSGNISVTIPALVVTTPADDAGTASNCTIQAMPGTGTDASCSLRDALLLAANQGSASITFDSTKFASATTITLANGTLNIPTNTTIHGPTTGSGASLTNRVTIDGGGSSNNFPVFTTTSSAINDGIQNLVITDGGDSGIYNGYAAALTVQNSTVSGNHSAAGTSGIFNDYNASLTVVGSTISGNSGAYGAIISESGGTVSVTDSTISGNTASNNGGGAILSGGTSVTVSNSTITGNSAYSGGGIYIDAGALTLTNSIVAGNTAQTIDPDINGAATDGGGNLIGDGTGLTGITNGTNGDQVGTSASPLNPLLAALGNYGGPAQTLIPLPGSAAICALSPSSNTGKDERQLPRVTTYGTTTCQDAGAVQTNYSLTFTTEPQAISPATTIRPNINFEAGVTLDESGSPFTASAVTIPLTLSGNGSLSNSSATTASGVATYLTLQVGAQGTNDQLVANLTLTAASTIQQESLSVSSSDFDVTATAAPAITSGNSATFTVGSAQAFTVTASGSPAPTFGETGSLPSGVTLSSTGVLSGTPAAGTGGVYAIVITASNGISPDAMQNFTLTVNQAPAITSASSATFIADTAGSFTATATGYPASTFTETGSLPTGVTFSSTGVLSGTPAAGTGGVYPIVIKASNGVGSDATQNFTLTVNQAPAITSASSATFTVGSAGSFTVTSSGYPAPTFSKTGALPTGVTLSSSGVLSGTPAAGTGGVYTFTITANNGVSPNATQIFTLTVDQAPAVTSAASAAFTTGTAGVLHVTSSGYPTAALTETGSLPSGVTFVDNGNGTAFLSGTPAAGTGGSYSITIQATNGISPNAQQSFTLTVDQAPAITSSGNATFTAGSPGVFTVTTSGFPASALTETGALPSGVTFIDNGNGTATLAGTATGGGTYPITITATNAVGTNATQNFTLTVDFPVGVTTNAISAVAETPFSGVAATFNSAANISPLLDFTATINWGDGTPPSAGSITQPGGVGTAYWVTGNHTYAVFGSYTFTVTVTPALGTPGVGTGTASVAPAPATHFLVTAPTSAYVGGAFNFTVTALDALNNPTTGYNGTAHFISTDPLAALPADFTFTNGTGTFSATLMTVGSQTITATDTTTSSLTGTSGAISVTIPSFVVENTNDSGLGSLRAALASAASAGSGNITFDPTAFATAQTITLTSGTLNVPSNTTITGPTMGSGASLANLVTVDGANTYEVFNVNSGVTGAALSNLTISDGGGTYTGGGIRNLGTLTMSNCTISRNEAYASGGVADSEGGGIFNGGTLTVTNSTFSGNLAHGAGSQAFGGAIFNLSGHTLTVSNSTFSGNSATSTLFASGGAILNAGVLTVIGSSFSGNSAIAYGGGIDNAGALTMSDSTFSGNSAYYGGGIAGTATLTSTTFSGNSATQGGGIFWDGTGSIALANTIVAGNTAGSGTDAYNGSSTFTDDGGNVIGISGSGSGNAGFTTATTQTGTVATPLNANLSPLGNYGGPTQTMIPLPLSPAICFGLKSNLPLGVTTDQRGEPNTNTTYRGYNSSSPCVDSGAVQTNYSLIFSTDPAATENSGQAFPAAITLSESGSAFTAASESIPVTLSGNAALAGSPVSASTSAGVASYSLTVTNPTAATGLQLMASLPLNGPAAVTASSNAFSLNPPIATTTMVASNLFAPWSANSQNVTLVVDVTASGKTVNSGALTIFRFVSVTTLSGTTYRIVPVTVPFTGSPATFTLSLPAGLTIGTYTLPVSYSDPNDVFAPSSDSSHTLTVGHAATSTTASSASATYSATAQNVTLSATVTSLAGTVNAGTVTFTVLQGSTPVGAAVTSGTISNGTASVSYTLPAATTAGTYTIQAVYNGTATFATSSDSTHTLTVNSAATTTAASNATATYSANAQSVTLSATVTSPSGPVNSGAVTFTVLQGSTPVGTAVTSATVSGGAAGVSYTLPAGTAAGTYTIQAVYSGTASLLTSSDSTHTLIVNTAATTTAASNATATFSATAQSVTLAATITSPSGPVNSGAVTFTVLQGSSPVGTAVASAVSNGAASVSYTLPAGTGAGTYTIQAVYSGTASLLSSSDSTHTLTVGKATATVMLGNLTQTYTGSPISITATTTPPGLTVNITYNGSPNPPTIAGSYTVVGTISDPNYTGSATGTLKIAQATPSIAWATPAAITYGTALSSTQLDAAATFNGNSLSGTFVYSPAAGTLLTAGPHTLLVTFTPTDTTDYTTATQTVQINVTQALPSITWATPAAITYGTALSSTQLNAAATFNGNSVAGVFAYSPAAGTVLAAGSHTLSATFTPTDTTDYTTATQSTTITVTGAVLTITANNATRVYGTANPAFTGSVTGQQNGDTFTESFTSGATISSPVNSYAIVPSVMGTNLADYTQSIVDGTLIITKAGSTITLGTSSGSITPGQSVTLTAQVSSDTTGSPTGTVSFYDGTVLLNTAPLTAGVVSYSTTALAPGITHTLLATYNGDTNFNSSSSTSSVTVVVAPLNFTMTLSGPSSATVVPGGSFTYQVTVTPDFGVYAGTVNFAVAGLPPGATATFSPSSIAANGGQQTITITIQTAPVTAMQQSSPPATGRHLAPFALAFLMLFGVGTMRKRGRVLRRVVAVALLLVGGAAATLLSGCGSKNGFFAQQPQSYAITITATSTTIQQSVTVNLNVE